MGRAAIKRRTTFLNGTISVLMGLIFGLVLIGLVEESLNIFNYPPLLESWITWSFGWQGYSVAYYQLVVMVNAAILGMNLGPGLLTILESAHNKPLPPMHKPIPDTPEMQLEPDAETNASNPPPSANGEASPQAQVTPPLSEPMLASFVSGGAKLDELQALHAQGEINDDEYKRARNKLLHEWRLARHLLN